MADVSHPSRERRGARRGRPFGRALHARPRPLDLGPRAPLARHQDRRPGRARAAHARLRGHLRRHHRLRHPRSPTASGRTRTSATSTTPTAPAAASTTTADRSTASSAWSRARCSRSTPSPTARHYADDIIWAGNEDEGFATSHRAINVGHHLGPWRWGEPTGNKINLWVIANCVSEENEIFEEWVLYNDVARLHQCGIDVRAAAREYGNSGASLPLGERELTEIERLRGGRPAGALPGADGRRLRRRPLRPRPVPRHLQPARPERHRPRVRAERALARRVAARGLRPRRRAQDGPRADGDVPRPRAARRRGLLDGQRGRGLQRLGALDRDRHPPRLRPLRRPRRAAACTCGASTSSTSATARITEEWALFNEFDVLAQLLRD